jgi:hypothetical protein
MLLLSARKEKARQVRFTCQAWLKSGRKTHHKDGLQNDPHGNSILVLFGAGHNRQM